MSSSSSFETNNPVRCHFFPTFVTFEEASMGDQQLPVGRIIHLSSHQQLTIFNSFANIIRDLSFVPNETGILRMTIDAQLIRNIQDSSPEDLLSEKLDDLAKTTHQIADSTISQEVTNVSSSQNERRINKKRGRQPKRIITGSDIPLTDLADSNTSSLSSSSWLPKGSKLKKLAQGFRLTEAIFDHHLVKRIVERDENRLRGNQVPKKLKKFPEAIDRKILDFGFPSDFTVNKINDVIEYGVFSQKLLQKGDIVGIYAGEFRLGKPYQYSDDYAVDAVLEIKLSREEATILFGKDHDYTVDDEYVLQVDATRMGNFTRYLNHTSLKNANVTLAMCTLGDKLQVAVQVIKKVFPGEQLLYDYGAMYWERKGVMPEEITPRTYMYLDSKYKKKQRTS